VNHFGIEIGEREYSIIDELIAVGKHHDANPRHCSRLGEISPRRRSAVIVCGTLAQLDANPAALDVVSLLDEFTKLDALSSPPATFLSRMCPFYAPSCRTRHGERSHRRTLAAFASSRRQALLSGSKGHRR